IDRAAERAHAVAMTSLDVPADRATCEPGPPGTPTHDLAVGAEHLLGHRLDAENILHRLEPGFHRFGTHAGNPRCRPRCQHGIRRAEAGARVDNSRPPHGTAHRERYHRIADGEGQTPVTVELEEALCRPVAHDVGAVDRRALLQHHHVESRSSERVGCDSSARTGSHHYHVGDDPGVGHLGVLDHGQVDRRRRPGRTQGYQRLAVVAYEGRYLWMGGGRDLYQ